MYLYSSHFYLHILIFICDNILSYVWQPFTIGILYELKSYLAGHLLCLEFVTWLELLCVLFMPLVKYFLSSFLFSMMFFPKGDIFYVHNFSYFPIKFTIFLSISLCWILKTQILKSGLANLEEIGLMSIKLFYVDIFLSFFSVYFLYMTSYKRYMPYRKWRKHKNKYMEKILFFLFHISFGKRSRNFFLLHCFTSILSLLLLLLLLLQFSWHIENCSHFSFSLSLKGI